MNPRTGERYDAALVDAYVRARSTRLRSSQLEVYVGHWTMRQSMREVAEFAGKTVTAIKRIVVRLRRAARRWARAEGALLS